MYYHYIQLWDWLGGCWESLRASGFLSAVSISVSVPCGWCVPSWKSQSSSQRRSLHSPGTSFIHVSDLFFAVMASQDSHRIYYRGVMKTEFIWQSPACIVWLGCNVKVSSLHYRKLLPQFLRWDTILLFTKKNFQSFQGEKLCQFEVKKGIFQDEKFVSVSSFLCSCSLLGAEIEWLIDLTANSQLLYKSAKHQHEITA